MNFKKIDDWLFKQKEGMILGGLVGTIIYYFNWSIPFIVYAPGTSNTTRLASLIFIGISVGALIDSIWRPSK